MGGPQPRGEGPFCLNFGLCQETRVILFFSKYLVKYPVSFISKFHWVHHPFLHWNCHHYCIINIYKHRDLLPDSLSCCPDLSIPLQALNGNSFILKSDNEALQGGLIVSWCKNANLFLDRAERSERDPWGGKRAGIQSMGGRTVTDTVTPGQTHVHQCGLTICVGSWESAPCSLYSALLVLQHSILQASFCCTERCPQSSSFL